MNDVASEIPDQWKIVGIQLGLNVSHLTAISQEQSNNCNACFSAVFETWKDANTPSYTWETIVKVLESKSVKKQYLANVIRKKYCT